MNNAEFCHLHVHNQYSLLDGVGSSEKYAKRAKKMRFEYLSLTNHGNIDGLIKHQKACEAEDIVPLFGCEMYIVPDLTVKDKNEKSGHLTVLVKNQTGWIELCRLLTIANLEGFYRRPRIDYKTFLAANLSGFVVLTGCSGSFLNRKFGEGFFWNLVEEMKKDLYLEIMPHDMPEQISHNKKCRELSGKYGVPLVATNDCHYILPDEDIVQEVLLAIQTHAKWKDKDRWKFDIKGLHLRSCEEMIVAFKKQNSLNDLDYGKALRNTIVIAEKCKDFRIERQSVSLPKIKRPKKYEGVDSTELLFILCHKKKLKILEWNSEYQKRLNYELEIIQKKKFERYFLIVWDLVRWCRKNDVMIGSGRGSVGGSIVAYLLGITCVDPLKYNLLFGRFINEERIDLPDIDIDFEDRKREQVRQYLEDTYGKDNVSGISTFLQMKGRATIRDVSRVFDISIKEADTFAKVIEYGEDSSAIQKAIKESQEGYDFEKKYPDETKIMLKLEGTCKSSGQHAAAVIISSENLRLGTKGNLCRRGKDIIVSNWDMEDAEYMGLVKLDILGLSALSILSEAKKLILENHKEDIVFEHIPIGDKKVLNMLSKGNTVGVFQLSTPLSTDMCKEVKIDIFEDIVSVLAIARPGSLHCVTGDTLIKCWSGRKIRIDDIDEGRPIVSSAYVEGFGHKYIRNKVKKVLSTGIKDIYKVITIDKKEIQCSIDHRFFVKSQRKAKYKIKRKQYVKKGEWKRLKEIKVGDLILTRNLNNKNKSNGAHGKKLIEKSIISRFKKGNIPWNKNKKRFMDYVPGGKRQTDKIEKRRLRKWTKERIENPAKYKKMHQLIRKKIKALYQNPKARRKQSQRMIKYYTNHSHPNEKGITISKPQEALFREIRKWFVDVKLEYRFNYINSEKKNRFFCLDIAIPHLKINIEYDGEYWHEFPGSRIEPRDSILEEYGWKVVRVTEKNKRKFIRNLSLLCPQNSIKFVEIIEIKKIGKKQTYDIFTENQNFPNYIANDFIVHNSGMTKEFINRKHGRRWEKRHLIYEEITKNTYGVLIFQEQVMEVFHKVAGLPYSVADNIRKIIGKKRDVKEFEKYKEQFSEGCKKLKTFSLKEVEWFWDMLLKCANYLFNRSHAVEYGILAYWTAYCKSYYSTEFICASLTYGAEDKKIELIQEAKRLGLKIISPKIGLSDSLKWKTGDRCLYVPFIEIKGFGESAAEKCLTKVKSKQLGFFNLFAEKENQVQGKTKIDKILNAIKAFDKEEMASIEIINKYLTFNIGT